MNRKISVIGLGYVGLPVAAAFGKITQVIGFDINEHRIAELLNGKDSTCEVNPKDLKAVFSSLEQKKGSGEGVYSIQVNGNWRVTFQIEDDGAILVDYCDYHGKQIKAVK